MDTKTTHLFNDQLRARTMKMATGIFGLFSGKKITSIQRPTVIQLIKSSSSVAANYRAATRGRSDAEYYAKICIVVEECDESQFWLEYLLQTGVLLPGECGDLCRETLELLKIFTTIKRKMKERLEQQSTA